MAGQQLTRALVDNVGCFGLWRRNDFVPPEAQVAGEPSADAPWQAWPLDVLPENTGIQPRLHLRGNTILGLEFERDGQSLPLAEVPARVYAEAANSCWQLIQLAKGSQPLQSYDPRGPYAAVRLRQAREALDYHGQLRQQALTHLLPHLADYTRLSLQGPYVCVVGRLYRYRLHCNHAAILVEPDEWPLFRSFPISERCTVRNSLYLPFEDEVLLTLLIQALALLRDDELDDPALLKQWQQMEACRVH